MEVTTSALKSPESTQRKMIIGLYGVSGSGKSYMLRCLQEHLGDVDFKYCEGSEMIASVTDGGLEAFHKMSDQEKLSHRQLAIDKFSKQCEESGQIGVVTGHCMFWLPSQGSAQVVWTDNDSSTYTHVLYVDTPAETILERSRADNLRFRAPASMEHLQRWKLAEKQEMRRLCQDHRILFTCLPPEHPEKTALSLIRHFQRDTIHSSLASVETNIDGLVTAAGDQLQTVFIFDGDKTLANSDSGKLFWELATKFQHFDQDSNSCPLKKLFSSALGYSDTAFQQASLLYEQVAAVAGEEKFNLLCEEVASQMDVRADFVTLLQQINEHVHTKAVVITCGLELIWEKVLSRVGLEQSVPVIGTGRIAAGCVVTPTIKARAVIRLRDVHHLYIWAFGDSVLDLPMMLESHQAIIVVGDEQSRSKSMTAAVLNAIDNHGFKASQVLFPSGVSARLDPVKLPVVHLQDQAFLESVLLRRGPLFLDIVNPGAAALLTTPMRNADISGPGLRDAHRRVGWYLVTTFLPRLLCLGPTPIKHVQGHYTQGHCFKQESEITIVALMRGGEPMAFGVSDAIPSARFLHARSAQDIELCHLHGQRAVLLVDSVVNSGKSVNEFLECIRRLHSTIQIIVVAGVVQTQASLSLDSNLTLVALRRSDNRFTGRGSTDTGNRLFGTTHVGRNQSLD